MIGKAILEDLPSELWLDIFTYLNTRDQYNGFYNLNTKINQFLLSYHYHISLKHNDENSEYLCEHVLPDLTHSKYISSLRLENINQMNIFQNLTLLHFPRLYSLTLSRLHITNTILDLLRYYAPHLQYLNISLFVSNKWNILLESILSLPVLQICYLNLGIAQCPIKSSNILESPIKHLTLVGSHHSCCMKKLTSLLNHLPFLNSLCIKCNKLECNQIISNQIHNKSLSCSSFSLTINNLPELFINFTLFLFTTMPHLEKLKIKCCNPLLNLVYINVYLWIKLLDLLINLKEIVLIFTLDKTINEKSWNKRYEDLLKFTKLRHINLRIISSKK
ncbi:unnamed protein product [Adineta steineri]|uniref:F-box domain-containing protein n=1 Tax=Adineta steineri TaxID=433720 RepID=A0A813U7P6_9BILA|nr:unnamed protein product [Adineta steineri]CAF0819889.1 unnamed protein product [Adineta steineri]